METTQSVLQSIWKFDWMFSIDLEDAYRQVPMHPDSHKFLCFVADGQIYQFHALCFGLSTAPQVFMRVMAPVSAMLHRLGIHMLRYLDDWLVLASSREEVLRARDQVLALCDQLGITINLEKSCLIPSQTAMYLGMDIVSPSLRAFPTTKRIATLQTQVAEFLSCRRQSFKSWRALLGRLSSLCQLVPGARLQM